MARVTNLELKQLLDARNAEIQQLRLRVSTLEGELALRAAPRAPNPNGVVVERHGQRVVKRWPAPTAQL